MPTASPTVSVLPTCPHCTSDKRQHKAGFTPSKSQRYHCTACDKDYTAQPKQAGYDPQLRHRAIALHLEGLSFRAVARVIGVNPQTVANWVEAYQQRLEQAGDEPMPSNAPVPAHTVELDEVHVFIGAKRGEKNRLCT
jgi:transposase-like protein